MLMKMKAKECSSRRECNDGDIEIKYYIKRTCWSDCTIHYLDRCHQIILSSSRKSHRHELIDANLERYDQQHFII